MKSFWLQQVTSSFTHRTVIFRVIYRHSQLQTRACRLQLKEKEIRKMSLRLYHYMLASLCIKTDH